ncbi:MAG: hypothetical protein AB8G11_23505 [Saprospiraceae bacterium]
MAKVTLKNTKSVIFKAYQEALAEAQKLQNEASSMSRALTKSKTAYDNAMQQLNTAKKSSTRTVRSSQPKEIIKEVVKVVTKVGDMSNLDGVIGALNSIQDSIGKAIAQCANMQVIEAEKLAELQEQIAESQKQLKDLYDIDFNERTLQAIIEDYEKAKETFTEAFEKQQATFKETYENKTKSWDKEQLVHDIETLELCEADETEQEREQTEYQYQLRLERNLESDTYAQKHKKLQEELAEMKEVKVEEFATREKAVKERETEFEDYKKKYDELPKRLEKATKEAEHTGKGIIERDAKIKMNLLRKQVENETKANDLKVKSLNAIIGKQEAQIDKLSAQLENALKQAQSLAIKAIEGTAHAESFNAMKAIAMEQAKNNGKSK